MSVLIREMTLFFIFDIVEKRMAMKFMRQVSELSTRSDGEDPSIKDLEKVIHRRISFMDKKKKNSATDKKNPKKKNGKTKKVIGSLLMLVQSL